MTVICHVMTPEGWARFEQDGVSHQSTRNRTLADEGFVHCSHPAQVDATLARYYADLPEVVIVSLDPERLDAEVVEEGGFPHVYGPLTSDAVVDVTRRAPG